MDPRIEQLLRAFDSPGGGWEPTREVALSQIGDTAELKPLAQEFVERGWLRTGGEPDTYSRTEDGRLAIAAALDVTLYSRPGCHLCEVMKAKAAPLIRRFGARLTEINIDSDPVLCQRYNIEVPVLLLGTRKVAKYNLDVEQFSRQLEAARKSVCPGAEE